MAKSPDFNTNNPTPPAPPVIDPATIDPGYNAPPKPKPTYTPPPQPTDPAAQPTSSPAPDGAAVNDYVMQHYGYLAYYLNDPEIGPILKSAAINQWDVATLEGALYKTNWWQQTSQSARQFDALSHSDPATAAAQVDQEVATARTMTGATGITVDPSRLRAIATDAVRLGWNTDQLRQALAAEYHYDPNAAQKGAAATSITQLKQLAADYGVPVGDQAMGQWMQQILGGQNTIDGFKQDLIGKAKSLYPTTSAALDAGQTVAQYFDPYKQIASQTLSLPPDSINFTDPKWQRALMQTDPEGNRIPMPLDQWTQTLKSDPQYGYGRTQQGVTDAYNMLDAIGKEFGRVA